MAESKKNIMTFAGLKALEDELFDLKVNKRKEVLKRLKKQENRATYLKMQNMMQRKTSREILRAVSRN